jgi:hypothetical protein
MTFVKYQCLEGRFMVTPFSDDKCTVPELNFRPRMPLKSTRPSHCLSASDDVRQV